MPFAHGMRPSKTSWMRGAGDCSLPRRRRRPKQWMSQGAFLMRGLENVCAEFSLTALAYNLRRVLNLVGFEELMAAVAA
jgi:hypothetical protein